MTEESQIYSPSPNVSLPLANIDYNLQTAACTNTSDWTATKTLPASSEASPYIARQAGRDPSTSNTPPRQPTDIKNPMAAPLDEDDLLFEVDFDTETLQQLHDVYERDRFPSDEKVSELASQAARRIESTEDGGGQVDEVELQRRVREWFSKERSKDAKNGKVRCIVGCDILIANIYPSYSHFPHQVRCHPNNMHSERVASSAVTRTE